MTAKQMPQRFILMIKNNLLYRGDLPCSLKPILTVTPVMQSLGFICHSESMFSEINSSLEVFSDCKFELLQAIVKIVSDCMLEYKEISSDLETFQKQIFHICSIFF